MNERKCPHPECKLSIDIDSFACLKHWRSLPGRIRVGINAAYRRYSRGADLGVLLDAQQVALDYWGVK